jgi:hypothetical protein
MLIFKGKVFIKRLILEKKKIMYVCTVASIKSWSSRSFWNFPLLSQMKNFTCLIKAIVNKTSIKKNCQSFIPTFKIKAPISYFNRVKIISLIETDVSEASVATWLGFPKSWQDLDKTRQIKFIRGYARFTLEHFPLCQRMTLTTKIYCSRQYFNYYYWSCLFFEKL